MDLMLKIKKASTSTLFGTWAHAFHASFFVDSKWLREIFRGASLSFRPTFTDLATPCHSPTCYSCSMFHLKYYQTSKAY